jgi:hypothetical protein
MLTSHPAMRNFVLCLLVMAVSHTTVRSQYVTIPDPKLLEALIDFGVDTNSDNFISFEEAEAVDSLALYNKITDMTGIEAFINLRYLDLANLAMETPLNLITYLDVSANTSLEYLDCSYNQLNTLIIGNNDKLLEMDCSAQFLTRLDLSGCPNLRILSCYGNPFEELDLSNSTQLEVLHLDEIIDPFIIYVWMLPYPPEGLTIYGPEAEVQYIDIRPPVVTLLDEYVYLPGMIEFSSDEEGMAYLVDSDTLDTMDEIRAACLDSAGVTADVPLNFDLTGLDVSAHWIFATDQSWNISEAAGFALYGVGIQNDPEFSVEVFPSPAREQVTIRSANGYNTVAIADMNGRVLFSRSYPDNSFNIDLQAYPKGVYFLRISDGRSVITRKLIKL